LYANRDFHDQPEYSPEKLCTILTDDTQNVRDIIELNLADLLHGFSAVCIGVGVAFYFVCFILIINFFLKLFKFLKKLDF
jgi:hypothetical protein